MIIDEKIIDTRVEPLKLDENLSVKLVVLVRKNFSLDGIHNVSDMNCYGKTIKEWAVSSAGNFPCQIVSYGLSDNVTDIVKPCIGSEKVLIALYAETPLIRHSTLVELVNDFIYRKQKVRKFKRGYIFDADYLKSVENVYAPEIGQEESEDFMPITNMMDLNNVFQIMKKRIMAYHISNGVQIIDSSNTYIEAEVEIEKGVIIYPNNNLLGRTIVQKGAILYPNNTIKDSIICENAKVYSSYLESAKVQANSVVEPFTKAIPKK